MLFEIGAGLVRQGFEHLIILNGNRPNGTANDAVARHLVDELDTAHTFKVSAVSYWEPAAAKVHAMRKSAEGGMGHGCEFETSFQLATRPELVKMERLAGAQYGPVGWDLVAPTNPTRTYARRPRPEAGHAAIFGDPTEASADAGRAYIDVVDRRARRDLPKPPGLLPGAPVRSARIGRPRPSPLAGTPAEVERDRMRRVDQLVEQLLAALVVARERLAEDEAEGADHAARRVVDRRRERAGERLHVADGEGEAALADLGQVSSGSARDRRPSLPSTARDRDRRYVSMNSPLSEARRTRPFDPQCRGKWKP